MGPFFVLAVAFFGAGLALLAYGRMQAVPGQASLLRISSSVLFVAAAAMLAVALVTGRS